MQERGSKRITRKLYNEELLSLYFSLNIVRAIKSRRATQKELYHACVNEECTKNLISKPQRRKLLERELRGMVSGDKNWIYLAKNEIK
jgi:hypothetical protein